MGSSCHQRHCVVYNCRGVGWSVETFVNDDIVNQPIELYNINTKLQDMIRSVKFSSLECPPFYGTTTIVISNHLVENDDH